MIRRFLFAVISAIFCLLIQSRAIAPNVLASSAIATSDALFFS